VIGERSFPARKWSPFFMGAFNLSLLTFHFSPLLGGILHLPSSAVALTLLAPGFWLLTPLQFALGLIVRFNKARSA
jgi:hypothetical protein